MFERKAMKQLEDWKNASNGSSALLIEGARRVGKSTLCDEFAKANYGKNYKIIDFKYASANVAKCFDDVSDLDAFFVSLFLALGIAPLPKGSLLVFDEVQFCVKAREAIKLLVLDGRYHYIETGSLISIKENSKQIQIPSEEERMELFPMDFEEFLWAIGKKAKSDLLREIYLGRRYLLDAPASSSLLADLRLYMAIGGMPQAVSAFVSTNDMSMVERKKREILGLYEEDLAKIDGSYKTNTRAVYDLLPTLMARQSGKTPLNLLGIDPRTSLFHSTKEKASESKIFSLVPRTANFEVGLKSGVDPSAFKVYMNDIGLGLSHYYGLTVADARSFYSKFLSDDLRSNEGYLYENLLCQMLRASGHSLYYGYWSENSGTKEKPVLSYYEIDFLFSKYGKVQPIECKSSSTKRANSLTRFKARFSDFSRKPIVVSNKPFQEDESKVNVPFYMAFLL